MEIHKCNMDIRVIRNMDIRVTRNMDIRAILNMDIRVTRNMDIRVTNIYVTKRQNPLILVSPEFCGTIRHTNSPFWSNSL